LRTEAIDAYSKLRILWFIELDYRAGLRHGGSLRFFNLAKELIHLGHEIYFVVRRKVGDEAAKRREFLESLKAEGMLTGYYEIEFSYPSARGKVGSLMSHPGIANQLLRKYQSPALVRAKEIIAEKNINLAIFHDRDQLFLLPALRKEIKVLVDWVDCATLYHLREIRLGVRAGRLSVIPKMLRYMADAFAQESYYGKRADLNLVVSPVDKSYLDSINRAPEKNRVLLNGLRLEAKRCGAGKIPNRIIFSGNMDFEPNYMAALWFIDNVLPLLLKERNDLKLVVAGANPVAELKAKASEYVEVTGYVEDMGEEIARSAVYVAPLVSGGGFKNKVIEAIASGTFVIATSMAAEFLSPNLQQHLLVSETPEEMAKQIISYLDDPEKFEPQLKTLQRIIGSEFTWEKRASELVEIARSLFSESKEPLREQALLSC